MSNAALVAHFPVEKHAAGDAKRLIGEARRISGIAAAEAARTEADRRLSPVVFEALAASGLLRALQPCRWGGSEAPVDTWLQIVAELARGCGSTGWVYSVLSAHAAAIANFPDAAQEEIWGTDPLAVASSAVAPTAVATRTDAGYSVSGKWGFSSGCDFASWVLAGARVADPAEGEPPMIFCLLPMTDLEVIDDWTVMGLKGTGSKSLVAEAVAIPTHRAVSFRSLLDGRTPSDASRAAYYDVPRHSWAPSGLAAVGAGVALGMVDRFVDYISGRKIMNGTAMADLESLQIKISESAAKAEAALTILKSDATDAVRTMEEDGAVGIELRARNRRDQAFATRLATSAVDDLYVAAGAYALFEGNDLQRSFRDMHAVAQQIVLNFDAAGKSYSRLRLGRTPDDVLL